MVIKSDPLRQSSSPCLSVRRCQDFIDGLLKCKGRLSGDSASNLAPFARRGDDVYLRSCGNESWEGLQRLSDSRRSGNNLNGTLLKAHPSSSTRECGPHRRLPPLHCSSVPFSSIAPPMCAVRHTETDKDGSEICSLVKTLLLET